MDIEYELYGTDNIEKSSTHEMTNYICTIISRLSFEGVKQSIE